MFLKSSSIIWLSFLLFLVSARLLVLQSFKMDFGEKSEVLIDLESVSDQIFSRSENGAPP